MTELVIISLDEVQANDLANPLHFQFHFMNVKLIMFKNYYLLTVFYDNLNIVKIVIKEMNL